MLGAVHVQGASRRNPCAESGFVSLSYAQMGQRVQEPDSGARFREPVQTRECAGACNLVC